MRVYFLLSLAASGDETPIHRRKLSVSGLLRFRVLGQVPAG
jgi:hypothetical protein